MAEESRIAVFVDFENLAIGTRDMHGGEFRIDLVQKRLLEKGRIVFKRAYCDWNRYRGAVRDFHANGIEMIDIPSGRLSGKNSADIRMVVDALDLCHSKGHIDIFALLTGDSDFSPLVNKLKENNKRVIGCGVRSSTSDLLVASCDEFLYYDELVRNAESLRRPRSSGGRAPAPPAPVASGESAEGPTGEATGEAPRSRRKSRGRRSSKARAAAAATATESTTLGAAPVEPTEDDAMPLETTTPVDESPAPIEDIVDETVEEAAPEEDAAPSRRRATKKKSTKATTTAKAAKEASETADEDETKPAAKSSRSSRAKKTKAGSDTTETEDATAPEDAAPAKAPRARRATKAKAKAEVAPEPEAKPDPQTEAVEMLVAIVSSLSQDYDPVWGSLAKQTLHRVHPDFSEERYGFAGFKDLLLEAGKRGYVDLEYDQGRGNYKIRMKA